MRHERLQEAVIEYRNAARLAPNHASLHWTLAQTALKINDHQTTLGALQRMAVLEPNHYEAMDMLGRLYLAAGRIHEAEQIADRLLTAHASRAAGYLLHAHAAAREGHSPAAISWFERGLQQDPSQEEAMLALGHLYLLEQRSADALTWYDRALTRNPASMAAHVARGNYYYAVGRSDDGARDFTQAIALGHGAEEARLAIALQHLAQGRPFHAEQDLRRITDATPGSHAHVLLTELQIELGKIADAERGVTALLASGKRDATLRYLQGRLALATHHPEDARIAFQDVIKQAPEMAAGHVYLGLVDLLEHRRAVGEERLLDAAALDPHNPTPHLILADLYFREDLFVKAEREAFEVLRRIPAHTHAATLYADTFFLRDQWEKAEPIYTALAKHLPHSPLGPLKMAALKQRQGFKPQAAEWLAEAARRDPADPGLMADYLLALVPEQDKKASRLLTAYLHDAPDDPRRWDVAGRLHLAMRRPAQAEDAWRQASKLAPHMAHPGYQLAQFYIGQQRFDAAEAALREALSREATYQPAHTSLGILLMARGRVNEAHVHYRRALELKPTDYLAANNLAVSLADREEDLDEALQFAQVALHARPKLPDVQDTAGWIYFKKGLLDQAYPLVTAAAGRLTDHPTVRYHLAMVLARRGEHDRAAEELEAALALSKNFPEAEEAAAALAQVRN